MGFLHRLLQASVLAISSTYVLAGIGPGCLNAKWNSDRDFFSTKFVDTDFDNDLREWPFIATYYNTYIKVMVPGQGGFIVLHCTKEVPPKNVTGENSLVVHIPVKNVKALDGLSQTFIDMLGVSSTIRAVGAEREVTSACINTQISTDLTFPISSAKQPQDIDVVFDSNESTITTSQVLIKNDKTISPLRTAAYIKLVGMFFGLEDLAVNIYNEIATNYRCTTAQVNNAVSRGNWPSNRYFSAVQYNKDSRTFDVAMNQWWDVLATDAGVSLVDVSDEGVKPNGDLEYSFATDNAGSKFAKESWAIVDTTQWLADSYGADAIDMQRMNQQTWAELSGASGDIYAVKKDHVFLADKTVGIWNRHDFNDRAPARPDIVLRDLLTIISPGFISHSTSFLRPLSNPSSNAAAKFNACIKPGTEMSSLLIHPCVVPAAVSGVISDKGGLTKGQTIGAAVGCAVGGAVVLAMVTVAGMFWRRRQALAKRNKSDEDGMELPEMEKQVSRDSDVESILSASAGRSEIAR